MDRQDIVREALKLLNESGLDSLSVRRIATRLGVKSPALYWHFKNKQELLDEMAWHLQSRQDLGPPHSGEAWREWLERRTRERRAVLLSYRDGARLVASSRPSPQLVEAFESELTALTTFGFTPKLAMRSIISLGHFVSGFVLEEQDEQRRYTESGDTPPQKFADEQRAAFLQSTPTLAAAIQDSSAMSGDEGFEEGMTFIIDGIAAALGHQ